ncbi:hypothetical protein C8J57DRAFT_1229958 [Mycena rebaudengoi]|nr:hypothetical protein C8J57DRAFT_1229958 [Mycena rebaudengoi]
MAVRFELNTHLLGERSYVGMKPDPNDPQCFKILEAVAMAVCFEVNTYVSGERSYARLSQTSPSVEGHSMYQFNLDFKSGQGFEFNIVRRFLSFLASCGFKPNYTSLMLLSLVLMFTQGQLVTLVTDRSIVAFEHDLSRLT